MTATDRTSDGFWHAALELAWERCRAGTIIVNARREWYGAIRLPVAYSSFS